jgi:hypothetical protein
MISLQNNNIKKKKFAFCSFSSLSFIFFLFSYFLVGFLDLHFFGVEREDTDDNLVIVGSENGWHLMCSVLVWQT